MSLEVPKNYWSRASETARHVFRSGQFETLDEQAGPAYLEGNLLSRWVFWRRLKHVLQRLPEPRGETCVDFGCGFGLLLPALATRYSEVVGVDLVPDLSRAYLERWSERSGESLDGVRIRSSLEDSGLGEASVDVMIALDVLEHCDDLGAVLDSMRRLLRPGGLLLVTGPTENFFYRLGRRIVGFSGDYHHRDIYDIVAAMEERFAVKVLSRLPPIAPLFLIVAGRNDARPDLGESTAAHVANSG